MQNKVVPRKSVLEGAFFTGEAIDCLLCRGILSAPGYYIMWFSANAEGMPTMLSDHKLYAMIVGMIERLA